MKGKSVIILGRVNKAITTCGESLNDLRNALCDPFNESTKALYDKFIVTDLPEMKSNIKYVLMGGIEKTSSLKKIRRECSMGLWLVL